MSIIQGRMVLNIGATIRTVAFQLFLRSYGREYRRDDKNSGVQVIFEQGRHPVDKGDDHMEVFVDSDYAADSIRRSTQGIVVMMNGGPISWSSVLGKTICTSTAEAEVTAAVSATKEALHLKLLLRELEFLRATVIVIFIVPGAGAEELQGQKLLFLLSSLIYFHFIEQPILFI